MTQNQQRYVLQKTYTFGDGTLSVVVIDTTYPDSREIVHAGKKAYIKKLLKSRYNLSIV